MSPTPEVSVIICTRDRPEMIARAVNSVLGQSPAAAEVLVVDQSATTATRDIVDGLRREGPALRYIHMARPGLSRAYNLGVRTARGDVLAFTDDDCMAQPGWLAAIAASFDAEPDVGLLYGQVLMPPELVARENVDGTTPFLPIRRRRHLNRQEGFEVFGMGANFAMRRSTWEQLGGFDEVLGGGGQLQSAQDFDFALRLYRHDGTVLLEPASVVYHYGFRSHTEWPATLKSYAIGMGGFCLKHIRLRDPYAVRLTILILGVVCGRMARQIVRGQGAGYQWTFLRHFFRGMRISLRFGLDRRRGLYYDRPLPAAPGAA